MRHETYLVRFEELQLFFFREHARGSHLTELFNVLSCLPRQVKRQLDATVHCHEGYFKAHLN
jgi:hypothetical protein